MDGTSFNLYKYALESAGRAHHVVKVLPESLANLVDQLLQTLGRVLTGSNEVL